MRDLAALKAQHDELLANKPEGVEHNIADCPFCNENPEGGNVDKTYSESELNAAVESALAPVLAELEALKAGAAADEVEQRIAAAQADADAKIADLQAQLDSAAVREGELRRELEDTVAYLTGEAEALAEAAALELRKGERLSVVRESAQFTDEYLDSNIDRWAALSDEDFASLVEDWKSAVASVSSREDSGSKSVSTAMNHVRSQSDGSSAVNKLNDLVRSGFDPRTV